MASGPHSPAVPSSPRHHPSSSHGPAGTVRAVRADTTPRAGDIAQVRHRQYLVDEAPSRAPTGSEAKRWSGGEPLYAASECMVTPSTGSSPPPPPPPAPRPSPPRARRPAGEFQPLGAL